MKNNIILFLLIFCWISVQADILVELTDPAGDDYGTGSIRYPENPMFVEGIFDLLKFT
ncbi:MAG: hypothetical protein JW996_06005, partial [Candidatus Cloacimonetes bacterium]|nr:hypothetical protein [Candidatus Cloacimonadota bacterium]